MGHGKDYYIITVHFIYDRIRKFAHDQAPPQFIEFRPTQRVLGDQSDSAINFALKVISDRCSPRIVPEKSRCIFRGCVRMKSDLSRGHALAF